MKRMFALLAAALVLASCASDKKQDPNAVPTITNPYSLEGTTIPVGAIPAATLHDSQRNKDIEMSIEYPTRGGPYPVIIFSPEFGGSRSSYVGLSAFWAGHGYVVIKPSHSDAGATRDAIDRMREERRAQAAQQEQHRGRRGRNHQPNGQQQPLTFRADPSTIWETAQSMQDWNNRVADVRFIIDSLPQLITQYPVIKDRLDQARVGVGGHAYGALTALMIAGAAGTTADPRVKAVEAMSPPGPLAARNLTRESFANVRVPALFLTGSRDLGATESEDIAWRKQSFEGAPAGDKWFVSIQNANRSSFTGNFADFGYTPREEPVNPYPTNRPPVGGYYPQTQPTSNPNRGVTLGFGGTGTVRTISLAFWDAYLKADNKPGRDYLNNLRGRGDLQVETK